MMHKLEKYEVENYSGASIKKVLGKIKSLKKGKYILLHDSLGGDAPKDFIQASIYEKGVRRILKKNWPKFIAKFGHKWYPVESITEHLFTLLGEIFGLNMASSMLRTVNGQLRFFSRYFLSSDEHLEHGAQIFSAYLSEQDDSFVDYVEQEGYSKEFFTFQFAKLAIESYYEDAAGVILEDFVRMLLFDAIVGNNDRHFYNWGVITSIRGSQKPRFSPVFDTARGLFWNVSEENLAFFYKELKEGIGKRFSNYIIKSKPKIGWDNSKDVNHFDLLISVKESFPEFHLIYKDMLKESNLEKAKNVLDDEFQHLMSKKRCILVKECISQRFYELKEKC